MNPSEFDYMIETMQAWKSGKKIQGKLKTAGAKWLDCSMPIWNWDQYDYRVAPEYSEALAESVDKMMANRISQLNSHLDYANNLVGKLREERDLLQNTLKHCVSILQEALEKSNAQPL